MYVDLCFCRFTKEDIQSMDFGAYLASSSSDESDVEGEELSGRGQEAAVNDLDKYKVMIVLLASCVSSADSKLIVP